MDIRERFLSHVLPIPEAGCWLWDGHVMPSGYAAFRMDATPAGRELAHRASYRLYRGEIPDDMIVCHPLRMCVAASIHIICSSGPTRTTCRMQSAKAG